MVVRDVVHEGDGPVCRTAQSFERRAFRRFGRHQRVGQAERVQVRPACRAEPVRHGGQQDDLGLRRHAGNRRRRAFGQRLPLGLRVEEGRDHRGNGVLIGQFAGRAVLDIAVQLEGFQRQLMVLAVEERHERPQELEDDIVDIEHQQRPRVERQLGDLPFGFRIVAHVERS